MKRTLAVLAVLSLALLMGCPSVVTNARDTAAALNGALVAAQTQHQASCTANPSQTACVTINKGIDGENLLISAIQTYCGWSPTVAPSDPTATCVPVSSALAGLNSAVANANTLIPQVKAVVQ
jgi:hypothetical protein